MRDYKPRMHDARPDAADVEVTTVLGGLRGAPVVRELMSPERAMYLAERLIRAARTVTERREIDHLRAEGKGER